MPPHFTMSVQLFEVFKNVFILPLKKDQKSNLQILKRVPWEKLKMTLVSYLDIFAQKWSQISGQSFLLGLCHSYVWTHGGICMDAQKSLHGCATEFASMFERGSMDAQWN